jgi:hypothetical protein
MLAMLLGVLVALLLVLIACALRRALQALAGLLRTARRPHGLRRLRGLRLSCSRALARAEGVRAAAMEAELRRLRTELRLLRAERDRALARASAGPSRRAPDDRFVRAKREFALRFHPDRLRVAAAERRLRSAIFSEYWDVLCRIERNR